ncbi:PLP-dependent aminotransferase family protein [Thermobrachium celere]|uniref:Transcriptional regulator, GntR family domain / Aspartate aminotransferase n=1 Tax=Thermobrachium celere DSM 8682 TaxID=941824 RepID=R7RV10_9CLOT|nr:PLP-dependent aminotransferase family protein [Thermobrachium celere]CDF59340.1 Transcriptional regulator, GntR family domain / Aspartate aminotransferase [Thermobrachium celere DSM 8682]
MFDDFKLNEDKPYYLQVKDYVKELILKGIIQADTRLPSTRELSKILGVSRNTIIEAYNYLEDEGFIYQRKAKGYFVSKIQKHEKKSYRINWRERVTNLAILSDKLDITKHEARWEKGMISFKSISPDPNIFDIDELKRAFLSRISIEEGKILNYGYAKGYRPLIDEIKKYLKLKGISLDGKDVLITNGYTEALNLVLNAVVEKDDVVLCENPTHSTAINIMKLKGLNLRPIDIEDYGLNTDMLEEKIKKSNPKFLYLTPSYHNPTGVVFSPENRLKILDITRMYKIPIIEDGFNEELRYYSSHILPLAALDEGNSIIYISSFSKVLFPGLRIGWILADEELINYIESLKRSLNIHTSFLDQAILYEYLNGGNLEKYINKVKRIYRDKFEWALECAKKYIPHKRILGEGGLHLFLELNRASSRDVLKECLKKNVIFTPGDIFYIDEKGKNTLRLGISRVTNEEIERGFKIIGDVVKKMEGLE